MKARVTDMSVFPKINDCFVRFEIFLTLITRAKWAIEDQPIAFTVRIAYMMFIDCVNSQFFFVIHVD